MKKALPYIILLMLLSWHVVLFAQDRFPRPEFETGYSYPTNQLPLQRAQAWEYIDVAVLIGALAVTTWLALKKRSRRGLIWMSVFSLAYFGFYRQGCICSVGSVQNVSLALFNNTYTIPLTALLFFIIPLLFALAYGQSFLCRCLSSRCNTGIDSNKTLKTTKNRRGFSGLSPFRLPGTGSAFFCYEQPVPDLSI